MKLTKRFIMVRGTKWKIRVKRNLKFPDDDINVMGYCDSITRTIWIEKNQPKRLFVETLLHEYLHALWFESGIDDEQVPEWIEHIFINCIAKDMLNHPSFLSRLLCEA